MSQDIYGEKGFIPFERIQGKASYRRPPRRCFRWRAGPCFVMIACAFVIATFVFDTFGGEVAPRYRQAQKEAKDAKKKPIFDGWEGLDRIFVFGESYSDIGFDVESTAPSASNPFGNPEFAPGTGIPRFGPTGPLWVHYATTVYNTSIIRTYDLAKGGSTIDRELVNPVFPTAGTFGDQLIKKFVPTYGLNGAQADWAPRNSLFAVFFGVMDLLIMFQKEKRAPVPALLESYLKSLQYMYESGARNFLLFTLPPVDRPYPPSKKGVRELRQDVLDFNARLRKLKTKFEARHHNINVWLFDTAAFFEDMIATPGRFKQTAKISYTKGPCPLYDLGIGASGGDIDIDRLNSKCGVPVSQYLWHDFIHTTYPTHDALAAAMIDDCMGARRKRYCS